MENTSTSFIDPVVGEIKLNSETKYGPFGAHSIVSALEVSTNKRIETAFSGEVKFKDNSRKVYLSNHRGWIKNPNIQFIYKCVKEQRLNSHYNH
jgi:hypothetical protein